MTSLQDFIGVTRICSEHFFSDPAPMQHAPVAAPSDDDTSTSESDDDVMKPSASTASLSNIVRGESSSEFCRYIFTYLNNTSGVCDF